MSSQVTMLAPDEVRRDQEYLTTTLVSELGKNFDNITRDFQGRILTMLEASFSDPEQRKAIKNLAENDLIYGDRGLYAMSQRVIRNVLADLYTYFKLKNDERNVGNAESRPYWLLDRYYDEDTTIESLMTYSYLKGVKRFDR